MKRPEDIIITLARQWRSAHWREQRLLSPNAWPMKLTIGKPDADQFSRHPEQVLHFIECWRKCSIGRVEWQEQRYRAADEAVSLPRYWLLEKPSDWVRACGDQQIREDYHLLSGLVSQVDERFRVLLIHHLALIRNMPEQEVLTASRLALELQPGIAQGRPLRALSIAGCDSKFFERNRRLLIKMLDVLFAGEVSETGLESFLGATSEDDHWLLVASLQPGLLPFERLRVRASELMHQPLPASRILLVENEQCVWHIPQIDDCIAILGAGLNLGWLQAEWLEQRQLAYWGDIDTWGLYMLATARQYQPHLIALMMDRRVFERHPASAVVEHVRYEGDALSALDEEEMNLFRFLESQEKGRLEQEFVEQELVHESIQQWVNRSEVVRVL